MTEAQSAIEFVSGMDDPRLLAAMEANAAHALAELSVAIGGERYHGPDMTRYVSGSPIAMFNGVISARFPADQVDAEIERTLDVFRVSSLPMLWWIGPGSSPPDLSARLVAHGLHEGDNTPCMAVNLGALAPLTPLPSVTFAQVTTPEQVEQFAMTAALGFEFGAEAAPIFQRIAAGACLPPNPAWVYHLAYLDGAPVATCVTLLHAGVAGLYTISTLPDARGHGIGGEITRLAMLHARSLGYRVATLLASTMGYPVYLRLGFVDIATMGEYAWTPPAPVDAH